MPGLSTTVTKVLEICNDPAASPNDLNRIISLDPVLTGQVIKLINSAYYALPNKITSLTRAIIMLGINTVKNLVLSVSIIDTLSGDKSNHGFQIDDFWAHSLCVGVAAKALARMKGLPANELEEYFVVGLLHDIGKIPLSFRFPDEYVEVVDKAHQDETSLFEIEESSFLLNHCIVGRIIADHWKLTDSMKKAISGHHQPYATVKEPERVTLYITLANIYANLIGMGVIKDNATILDLREKVLKSLDITENEILGIHQSILQEIEKAKVFLQVAGKG